MAGSKRKPAAKTPKQDCPAEQAGESPPVVPAFKTLDDVASHFGISRRSVMDWRGGGMPWREGGLPQGEIFAWVATHKRKRQTPGEGDPRAEKLARRRVRAESRLAIFKARREELRLAREEGRYADLETLLRVCERSIAEARSYLACLPDECVARLGSIKLTARAKTELRGLVSDAVKKAEASISGALSAWADELVAQRDGFEQDWGPESSEAVVPQVNGSGEQTASRGDRGPGGGRRAKAGGAGSKPRGDARAVTRRKKAL